MCMRFCRAFQWDDTTIETVVLDDWDTRNGLVDHTVYRMVTQRVVVSVAC